MSNLSESGRRIEQISEDITRHRSPISKADSLIIHVSSNNLQRDSLVQVKSKLRKLQDTIRSHVSPKREVAMSSVISRKDEHAPKVGPVNDVINKMCIENRWTYIDNSSVKDLSGDKLHPTSRGISFLARNFQDLLKMCPAKSVSSENLSRMGNCFNDLNFNSDISFKEPPNYDCVETKNCSSINCGDTNDGTLNLNDVYNVDINMPDNDNIDEKN